MKRLWPYVPHLCIAATVFGWLLNWALYVLVGSPMSLAVGTLNAAVCCYCLFVFFEQPRRHKIELDFIRGETERMIAELDRQLELQGWQLKRVTRAE